MQSDINSLVGRVALKGTLLIIALAALLLHTGIVKGQNEIRPETGEPVAIVAGAADDGIDAFRLINERNIFDPNRRRRVERVPPPVVATRREPKVESFALTGTITYARGTFAFFDGSSDGFRKAVKAGDEFSGFSVISVGDTEVVLGNHDESIHMKVGEQLRREDESEWKVSARSETYSSARKSESGPSDRGRGDGNAEGVSSGDESESDGAADILKRLMEKRQKEMNQ